ncbi:rhamnogalacturonan acetylesterase [Niastella caeni]|uniref:Rhamnogalacturonan acetylesterase n=1 Tax=Niastella caeni TaxID=2569763 RepID=A0A4S8HAF5_9BACT|nr:rhamnogalacturonan acetylesterase [Niastella caeni]THU31161.1 rhamnogalacturonan acetylesterase [Niastella caeni]
MKLIGVSLLLITTIIAKSQTTSYKFDFGINKAAKGYIAVTPTTTFSYKTGYGFDQGSEVQAIDRGGNALTGDYITSSKPFYFSVKLPDGNYDVKVMLGDTKGNSATTVRAECRRLMLENIRTDFGKLVTKTFTVHVKDSMIRDAKQAVISNVKLKPREGSYLHWDNLLTLEFNDSVPKVCAVEITPNKKATTIFLAGNSTVVDQSREPWAAWGQMIPRFFEPGTIAVANYAESGETMKAFARERRLEKIFSLSKPGDYLFIEFTHNDQKPGGNHLDPFTTYKQTIKEWVAGARKRGMTPVLVTSMHRRNFDSTGHIINTLADYPEAMRQTAAEEKVALIDLNAMSKTLFEAWGPEQSLRAFVHYAANTFPGQDKALADNTHFSPYGAYELARCVVKGMAEARLPIAKYLVKEKIAFDPAHPDAVESFYWPLSSFVTAVKPDGN